MVYQNFFLANPLLQFRLKSYTLKNSIGVSYAWHFLYHVSSLQIDPTFSIKDEMN